MPKRYTIYCKLVAKQEGMYSQYVFENLDLPGFDFDKYVMVTKCPNWQCNSKLELGTTGFLLFEPIEAGSTYYDPNEELNKVYKYSAFYFINFIEGDKNNLDNNLKEFNF